MGTDREPSIYHAIYKPFIKKFNITKKKKYLQVILLARTKHMHNSTPFSPSFKFINVNFFVACHVNFLHASMLVPQVLKWGTNLLLTPISVASENQQCHPR